MSAAMESIVAALRQRGVIDAEAPELEGAGGDRPWFIALMQGVAGWLAGIFLIVFIGLLFKPEKTATLLVLGSLLLGAAWLIYNADREGMFLDQLALAISIAGQVAVAWGVIIHVHSGIGMALTLLVLQLAVLAIMPNSTARTLATLFAIMAWVYVARFLMRPGWDWDEDVFFEYGVRRRGLAWLFACWLVTWMPLIALAVWFIRREPRWMASDVRAFARPVLTGLLLGVAIGGTVGEPLLWLIGDVPGMGMNIGWAALFPMLSLGLALLTAYGGFRLRMYGLLGFGIVMALLHMARFYYMYGTTLLVKSVIMLVVGVGLLALGAWLKRGEFAKDGA
jgi:hypothetical protein